MTVAELKALLKESGLPVSGNKSVLVARLSDNAEDDSVEEAVVEETASEEVAEESQDSEDDLEDFDDDEDWDDEEPELHVAKQKPVLDDATKAALLLRAEQKKLTPNFLRTEWFRYKRLSRSGWRRPKGMDNKQRRNYKYRGAMVRVGHGKVAAARGLHSSGFREVMVQNPNDLEAIDPETEAARVGRTVGGRKRERIHDRADELGIRILNRRRGL
ncbi:MAG: 50S ribosomal protein L32e [Euryarchaeota archaeon]|nr:50S ribosomal protein L32e [Euryarchaeota archaeon]MBT7938002.1 50S ribosomal protein L32e [Euryarchaeota archaeon]